ncbi:MAG: hypothetical protein AMXMBFR84_42620 [Candidatus Hydrogenedentota bacterium]
MALFRGPQKVNKDWSGEVLAVAARVMKGQGITIEPNLDASLSEEGLGLTSMGRLELLAAVERELGVSIPEDYWGAKRISSLGHLVRLISR